MAVYRVVALFLREDRIVFRRLVGEHWVVLLIRENRIVNTLVREHRIMLLVRERWVV